MLSNINFQIWFKVARPIKRKYRLSTNCTLVLNGAYVLQSVTNKPFTQRQLRTFTGYFNYHQLDSYITVLINKGYLIPSESNNTRCYYKLSETGLQVIKELNESYDSVLYQFCNDYSIIL